MPLLVLLANPVKGYDWLIIAPVLLVYYLAWLQLKPLPKMQLATLSADGDLHWFAPLNDTGRIKAGGLVCLYALRVNWYSDNQQRVLRRWIFSDQCQVHEFRALARLINQTNWSCSRSKG